MANKGRPSWDELHRRNRELERKLDDMKVAMKEADRAIKYYHLERWVATPMHPKQTEAVLEYLHGRGIPNPREGKKLNEWEGEEKYEEVMELELLPNVRHFVVHYVYVIDSGETHSYQVWALVPA